MSTSNQRVGSLFEEMSKTDLGDKRLNRRVGQVCEALSGKPDVSFPKAFGSEAFIEAFYRLLRNPRVNYKALLEAHTSATRDRITGSYDEVLSLHDSTRFKLKPDESRDEIGWVHIQHQNRHETQGFFGHFALAVSADSRKIPLGILGFEPRRRLESPPNKKRKFTDPEKESLRWGAMAIEVEAKIKHKTSVIHVMDSEADNYQLFSQLTENGSRFVIRACHDRKIKNETLDLHELLETQPCVCTREVELKSRRKSKKQKHPSQNKSKRNLPREVRVARLGFSSGTVEIKRPENCVGEPRKTLELNVIHVFEIDTPKDAQPVDWKLFTTEPIETEKALLRVVDFYRSRWLIEEYFKAIKTGCSYEKRELESYGTLLNALALIIPVAWQLLFMRQLSRRKENQAASDYFSPSQIEILRLKAHRKLSEQPTVKEAVLAIASLGGHMKSNGDPGWLVIGRGFYDLLMMDMGYKLAESKRCDQ